MKSNQQISEEEFSAKEREICLLFGIVESAIPATDENDDSASEERIQRIMDRARREPSSAGEIRIERILTRLKDRAAPTSEAT